MSKDTDVKVKKEEDENVDLESFSWDEDLTMFGQEITKEEDLEDEPIEKKKPKPTKKEDLDNDEEDLDDEEEEVSVPEEVDDEDDEDEQDTTKKKKKKKEKVDEPFSDTKVEEEDEIPEKDEAFFKVLAGEMKEAGVFANVKIGEDEEIDEERFIELQDEEIDSRVNETFEAFFEELDEDGKEFLKFKKSGGDTREFFRHMKEQADTPDGDLDDEAFQKTFLRHYYETYDDMDAEDIDAHLELLEDGGRLGKYAKKFHTKVENLKKEARKDFEKRSQQAAKDREKAKTEYQSKLKGKLEKVESIGAFPVTVKDKKELYSYITKPVQKIGKNNYITQFQADMNGIGKDFEKLILMAKLVKQDFDISDIEKKVETKKVSRIKEKLTKQRNNRRPGGGSGSRGKSLSDFFSD